MDVEAQCRSREIVCSFKAFFVGFSVELGQGVGIVHVAGIDFLVLVQEVKVLFDPVSYGIDGNNVLACLLWPVDVQ